MPPRDRFVDINNNQFDVGSKVYVVFNGYVDDKGTIVGVNGSTPLFQSERTDKKARPVQPNDLMVIRGSGYSLPVGEKIARSSLAEENIRIAYASSLSKYGSSERKAQTNVIAETPEWPGADAVYSYLYKVLEKMGSDNWAAEVAQAKKRRTKPASPHPTDDMKNIMDALDAGDEERLKDLHMKYKTSRYV